MKRFLKIDFSIERTPDATTLLHFRHLLEKHDYRIAKRPSQNRTTKAYAGVNWDKKIEHEKTSIRCKAEHPFLIVKRLFQAGRTRYRGIKKNLLRYDLLFASADLVMCLRAGRQRAFCMTMG